MGTKNRLHGATPIRKLHSLSVLIKLSHNPLPLGTFCDDAVKLKPEFFESPFKL